MTLWLLLSGCGQVRVAERPQEAQAVSTPVTIDRDSEEEKSLEVEAPPTPEARPVRVRLAVQPPPQPPKPPPPPTQKQAPPARPQTPPRPIQLEASYPKAQQPYTSVVDEAEAASLALDRSIQSGQLLAVFQGTGDPQEMVHFRLVNHSDQPVRVHLVPGMILNPPAHQAVQPLLVTEEAELVLQPGQSHAGNLVSYCMDSRVPAPLPGQPVQYRFSTRTQDGGPEAVRAHAAADKLVKSSPYRHAITQIAIWKSLKQRVEDMHFYSVLGPAAYDPEVRKEVLREVERVLSSL